MIEDVYDRIKKLETWLRDFKSSQKVSGDSWILYEYIEVYPMDAGTRYAIFKLSNDSELATVYMFQQLIGFEIWPIGITSDDFTTYFWECPTGVGEGLAIVTSTQPGTLYISDTPPF